MDTTTTQDVKRSTINVLRHHLRFLILEDRILTTKIAELFSQASVTNFLAQNLETLNNKIELKNFDHYNIKYYA